MNDCACSTSGDSAVREEVCGLNIWTEQLKGLQLTVLERWIGRRDGAVTPNDLPEKADELSRWFEICATDPERLDYLVLAYETPVGLAGLRWHGKQEGTAELYLLFGEVNYNLLRTATYAALKMLDRAFLDLGFFCVTIRIKLSHDWFLDTLKQMGFSCTGKRDGFIHCSVEKNEYLHRKYLF